MVDKKTQGKRNKAAGQRFELKVRKDLEFKSWVVSKWMNNVELEIQTQQPDIKCEDGKDASGDVKIVTIKEYSKIVGKLIQAKHKFCGIGRPMSIGTGFPDFIAFRRVSIEEQLPIGDFEKELNIFCGFAILGVEVKSNGYLTKEEKAKCRWLLDNNIFSKILIVSKGKKRGEIVYKEYGKI